MNAEPGRRKLDAHLWERDPEDFYVEPVWCSRALFAREEFIGVITDPACGLGRVLDAARERRYQTFGMDIVDRGAGRRHRFRQCDFFIAPGTYDNIVCNPPYKYDDEFLARAIERTTGKCALLLRANWANAGDRSKVLEQLPLRSVLACTPRPSMPPGRVIETLDGRDPSGGRDDYFWFVFERGYHGEPTFGWARRDAA